MTEEMTEDRAQQLLDAIAAVREALTGRNLAAPMTLLACL